MKKIPIPSREEVYEYYVTQCHSHMECLAHFGISHSTFNRWLKQLDIAKTIEDTQNTNLRIYGTPYAIQSEEVQTKKNTTLLNKYGHTTSFYDPAVQERIRQTMLEKYGVEHPAQNSKVRERIAQTCIERYGGVSALTNPEIQAKSQETCLQKYDAPHAASNPDVRQKITDTCLQRYGVTSPLQNADVLNKMKRRQMRLHGYVSHMQKHIQHRDIWLSHEALRQYLTSKQDGYFTITDLAEFFNVTVSGMRYKIHAEQLEDYVEWKPSRSVYEDEIAGILQSWGIQNIKQNVRDILENQEIDLYLEDYKIGIEFNGDYWHSDIYHSDHGGRSTYHQSKSLAAERKGIFLFHIFEYEWTDPIVKENILNRLRTLLSQNTCKIPARKCQVQEITPKVKGKFLALNHIQGNDHSVINLGLFYNGELMACMTFAKPRSAKYTWELSRFCTKHGYNIQGGASKLFVYFIKQLRSGDVIVSYNDITKTTGKVYPLLGFEFASVNAPNYVWMNFLTGDIRSRYQEKEAGEAQRMHDAGYHRICDCGTKTWIYKVK